MFCILEETYKETCERRKTIAMRKLNGKIESLKMLVNEAPKEIREKMRKQIIESFSDLIING